MAICLDKSRYLNNLCEYSPVHLADEVVPEISVVNAAKYKVIQADVLLSADSRLSAGEQFMMSELQANPKLGAFLFGKTPDCADGSVYYGYTSEHHIMLENSNSDTLEALCVLADWMLSPQRDTEDIADIANILCRVGSDKMLTDSIWGTQLRILAADIEKSCIIGESRISDDASEYSVILAPLAEIEEDSNTFSIVKTDHYLCDGYDNMIGLSLNFHMMLWKKIYTIAKDKASWGDIYSDMTKVSTSMLATIKLLSDSESEFPIHIGVTPRAYSLGLLLRRKKVLHYGWIYKHCSKLQSISDDFVEPHVLVPHLILHFLICGEASGAILAASGFSMSAISSWLLIVAMAVVYGLTATFFEYMSMNSLCSFWEKLLADWMEVEGRDYLRTHNFELPKDLLN